MSLARVQTTKGPVRKDGLKCGRCGDPIRKGVDRRRTFSVGFRGYEQTRCMKPACTPTRSELESSIVASIYAAMDDVIYDALESMDDVLATRDDVAEAIREVASEYEDNEMFEVNYGLQERADILNSAADELESWEPVYGDDEGSSLLEAREALQEAIEGVELP